jgi:hypothetical protein
MVPAREEPPEPLPTTEVLLTAVRLLPLHRLQTTTSPTLTSYDYFVYNRKLGLHCDHLPALTSCSYIGWGHSTISMTDPSDSGKSADSVTLPSTGYFLRLMFMFISCIIMNIFMFNCCLNINTCTWIVSLTVILKCIFNYRIKIYQNIVYHLTVDSSFYHMSIWPSKKKTSTRSWGAFQVLNLWLVLFFLICARGLAFFRFVFR